MEPGERHGILSYPCFVRGAFTNAEHVEKNGVDLSLFLYVLTGNEDERHGLDNA